MKEALIVGGANGIGLAVAMELASLPDTRCVHIVDKAPLAPEHKSDKIRSYQFDLTSQDYSFFDQFIKYSLRSKQIGLAFFSYSF